MIIVKHITDYRAKWDELKLQRDLFAFFLFDNRRSHQAVMDFVHDQFEWLDTLAIAAEIYFFLFAGQSDSSWLVPAMSKQMRRQEIHKALLDHFDDEELRTLCFFLNVNYDDLPANSRQGKARELISRMERDGRIPVLLEQSVKMQPEASEDFMSLLEPEPEFQPPGHSPFPLVPRSPALVARDAERLEQLERIKGSLAAPPKNPGLEVAREFGIKVDQLPGIVLFTLGEDKVGVSSGVYYPIDIQLFDGDATRAETAIADLFTTIQDVRAANQSPKELIDSLQARLEEPQEPEIADDPMMAQLLQSMKSLAILPKKIDESLNPAIGSSRFFVAWGSVPGG